jgi:SAM-dependent methyltransferase
MSVIDVDRGVEHQNASSSPDATTVRRIPLLIGLRQRLLPHWTDQWPAVVAKARNAHVLHLGAGLKHIPGAVTVDLNPDAGADVAWNLDTLPWPFPNDSFDAVVGLSIIEHLQDFLGVMGEIHRVLKPNGTAHILVPHFSSAASFVDPTHKQHLSARSCDYFIAGSDIGQEYGFYVPFRFELVRRYIHLQGLFRYVPGAEWAVSRFPALWEEYLCFVVRGGGIFWELRAVKR